MVDSLEIARIAKKFNLSPGEVEVIADLDAQKLKLLKKFASRLEASARAELEHSQDMQKIFKSQGILKAFRRLFGEIEKIMEELKNG